MTRSALGPFLRIRRDRLTPAEVGLRPFPGARRVPGLRRDEVAALAGVSRDYYSRLEQGRQTTVSTEVLAALARALRMSDTDVAHMHDLAGARPARRRDDDAGSPQRPNPGLLRMMTALDHLPVLLMGRRGEVLATNNLLGAVLGVHLEPGSSFIRFLLNDPWARDRIVNWTELAQQAVAGLRRETGRHPRDHHLTQLIADLRRHDPDIDRWWQDQQVRDFASTAKIIRHPQAGDLVFHIEHLVTPLDDEQHLIVYTVQPDSETATLLPLLASWTPAGVQNGTE